MGKFFICCWIQLNVFLRVRLKPWNDRVEFELDCAGCNKNIAENSFALGTRTWDGQYSPVPVVPVCYRRWWRVSGRTDGRTCCSQCSGWFLVPSRPGRSGSPRASSVPEELGLQLRKSEQNGFHDNFFFSQPNPMMWPSLKSSLRDDSNEW